MRAAALGLMLLLLAGSLVDLREWRKLPELATHFREHRSKNASLTFGQFLFLHYGAGAEQHRQKEPLQHEQLPYGSTAKVMSAFFFAPSAANLDAGARFAIPLAFNLYESSLLSTHAAHSIWQPPRI